VSVTETSREAYESVCINDRQAEVLAAVEKLGPCSDLEISIETGLPINSITPRRGELVEAGLLVRAGEKRGATGRRCYLWTLRPRQADLFASAA
jgi:DNA-binding MarR family transcriptional regulator